VWISSSDKRGHDATARTDRIERARVALGELNGSLRSKRSRLRTQAVIEAAPLTLKSNARIDALGFCL